MSTMTSDIVKVLITALIAPAVLLILKYRYDKKSKDDEKKSKSVNIPELKLINHPFFERMEFLESSVRYNFELANKGKELITKEVLITEFSVFTKNFRDICTYVDEHKDISDDAFYTLVLGAFNDSVTEYSAYHMQSGYTPDELQCLTVFMTKFNRWNYERLASTNECLQMIANSKFYNDPRTRLSAMMDMLLGQFIGTLNDAERTLGTINGDLRGLKFKGVTL